MATPLSDLYRAILSQIRSKICSKHQKYLVNRSDPGNNCRLGVAGVLCMLRTARLELSQVCAVAWNARKRPDCVHTRRLAPSPHSLLQRFWRQRKSVRGWFFFRWETLFVLYLMPLPGPPPLPSVVASLRRLPIPACVAALLVQVDETCACWIAEGLLAELGPDFRPPQLHT